MSMEKMFGYTDSRWSTPRPPQKTRRRNGDTDPSVVTAAKARKLVTFPRQRVLSADYTTRIQQIVHEIDMEPVLPPSRKKGIAV